MSEQMFFPVSDTPSDTASDTSDNGRLSVRLDSAQNDDLLTIMQAAGTQSNAVRYALSLAASVCRQSWDLGHVHPRELPVLNAYMVNVPGAQPVPVRLRRGTPAGGVGRV